MEFTNLLSANMAVYIRKEFKMTTMVIADLLKKQPRRKKVYASVQ